MRERLARLIADSAKEDPKFCVLSGDHGYALFDPVRKESPNQFINVGVAEQGMIGIASGLARLGFRPFVYGLAAFVPIRTLEQIKLDICFSKLPVILLGDGGGLVYSTLGASHHSAEDLAALRALPGLRIYTPADAFELEAVFREARAHDGPSYIRVGKSDRPAVSTSALSNTHPYFSAVNPDSPVCLIAHGSMSSPAQKLALTLGLNAVSVPRLVPFDPGMFEKISSFEHLVVLEEASRYGGLFSTLAELAAARATHPRIHALTLGEKFADKCGSYQYALSEHGLSDTQLEARVIELIHPIRTGRPESEEIV